MGSAAVAGGTRLEGCKGAWLEAKCANPCKPASRLSAAILLTYYALVIQRGVRFCCELYNLLRKESP